MGSILKNIGSLSLLDSFSRKSAQGKRDEIARLLYLSRISIENLGNRFKYLKVECQEITQFGLMVADAKGLLKGSKFCVVTSMEAFHLGHDVCIDTGHLSSASVISRV